MAPAELSHEQVAALQQLWYGHQNVPKRSDFEHAWKAIKAVGTGDGQLTDTERLHLLGKMCAIGTPPDIVDVVMAFDEHSASPESLVAGIDVPDEVRAGTGAWVVYEGISLAMSDGDLAEGELDAIRRTASAMGVTAETVDALAEQCSEEAAVRERRIRTLFSTIPTDFRFAGNEPDAEQPA